MKKKAFFLSLAVTIILLFVSCGLSSKQKTSAEESMKSLRKLAAAVQVGVNYIQYSSFIIDAQALVNDSLTVLPEGELKKEINASMEAYVDARKVWSCKIDPYNSYPETLISKYSLKKTGVDAMFLQEKDKIVSNDKAISIIWGIALIHLNKAESLL
ncbi:MAG: hypothetical protein C4518_08575 [Desulfobacteraceae bacterium]|nr:MAG: hypothetical protein C4518_08575 [Desulfobacteraceae bacterium]